jgi:hypothetical protein
MSACMRKPRLTEAMAIIDRVFRTIACDGPNCAKTVTFEKNKADNVVEQHPWLKTARLVQAAGRDFVYCSDLCVVAAISGGTHNPRE